MKRLILILALLLVSGVAAAGFFRGGIQPGSVATITSVTVTPGNFLGGSADGTSTGAIAINLSTGSFTGTIAIGSGGQGTAFRLSSNSLPANLLLNGTQAAGTYTVNVVPTQAGLGNSGTPFPVTITGTAGQTIASITPTTCSFTAGVQNGAVCNLAVTMMPASPASTAALTLTGANSGAFHLVGAGCANISAGVCTIEQSAAAGGTPAGTYADVSAVATQGSISNSPFTQSLNLAGSSASATITSVGSTNYTFAAQAGNANSTIGTLSVAVSSGSFGGTLALATLGACTGTNNGLFAISGSTLKIGASDITTPATYSICVRATDAAFTNSPFYQALTLTGTGAGLVVTTATIQNDTGSTLPAGTPVSFGQGFRYSDIMPGTYPLIRDASTHTPLAGQQWDEIATYKENGGNGSWRHAVWAAWLPTSVASGATYQVEFLTTAGTYSESSRQPLSALCSGAAAHDLKAHLTDVRNQNDTMRDSGDATFDICSNIANTGRDAPRHLRAGNVYDEYVVSGMPLYTSGHKDPLLYVQCIVDIFTKASDGTSAGDVRWVCHMHNSWENVAPGSTGNAGNPGPAGFAGDPQAVSYRAEIDDGASDVLDWSGLDATVASTSNPIVNAASNGCNSIGETVCLNVPSSTGANTWFYGMATRVSSTGTPVAGLTNGQLYYIWPSGSATQRNNTNTQFVSLFKTPSAGDPFFMTSSQGSGNTTFSTRVQHYHFETWQTLDATEQDNWAPFGTTTRVTRKVYPALTAAEKLYWEESGVIIPLYLSQPTSTLGPDWHSGLGNNYEPFGRMNVIGGVGGGTRPDLGISSEWAAKAFVTQNQQDWDLARLFTFGGSVHGYSTMLDESTGRISPLNNGPPTGPGGNGNGGTYAGLGALRNQIQWVGCCSGSAVFGLVDPNHTDPATSPSDIAFGTTGGTAIDHMPSFDGFTYIMFGDRHFLDMMQWQGNRDFAQQRPGPGSILGQGVYRDNNAKFTDGNTYHYWGLTTDCCQGRGSAWLTRDVLYPATFGQDPSVAYPDGTVNSERAYFHDMITETGNYWPLFLAFRDGPSSTNYSSSVFPPNEPDTVGGGGIMSVFVTAYVGETSYLAETWLHEPVLGSVWNSKLQRYYEGVCGGQLPGNVSDYYCTDEIVDPYIHNGDGGSGSTGALGPFVNGIDASDFGSNETFTDYLAGGQFHTRDFTLTAGDTMRTASNGWDGGSVDPYAPIDQLPGTRRAVIMGPIDNTAKTFYIQCNAADHATWPTQCPVAGQAFTGFTRGGVPITTPENNHGPSFRLQFDPGAGAGYRNDNYAQYTGQMINSLSVLGFGVGHAMSNYAFRCIPPIGASCYSTTLPSNWWDGTVVVPGLPPAVNTVPQGVFDNGGSPWAFTALVPAVDYDTGGQNIAYHVTGGQSCTALGYGRTDCINFKPYSGNPSFRLGFSAATDSYNYSINVASSVSSQITVMLADTGTGGSWTVKVDGNTVATVATPNTGSFDTFQAALSTAFTPTTGNHTLQFVCNGGDAFNGCGDFLTWQGGAAVTTSVCNNPTVPHPAQAAGFTSVVYCADFTQETAPNNVYNGSTLTTAWHTMANWLQCAGASSPQWGLENFIGHQNNCNDFSVVNDSVAGSNVLQIQVTPSDIGQPFFTAGIATAHAGSFFMSFPGTNNYAEARYRMDTSENNNIPSGGRGNFIWDFWSIYQNSCGLEIDFIENHVGVAGGNQGITDYCSGSNPVSGQGGLTAPAYDSLYHTVGSLNTNNGSSGSTGQCGYADGVASVTTCQSKVPNGSTAYLEPSALILWNNAAQGDASTNTAQPVTGNFTIRVEWIRIWGKAGCFSTNASNFGSGCAATNVFTGTPP